MASKESLDNNSSFVEETSIGGIKYVGDKSSTAFRRFVWLIIVLGAAIGLGLQGYKIVNTFILKPVTVNIERLEVGSMPFPALTICNNNLIRRSILAEHAGFLNLNMSLLVAQTIFNRQSLGGERHLDIDFSGANYGVAFGNDLRAYMETVAHKMDDAVLWCRWRGEYCGPENFTETLTNYGVCFTFNSGKTGEILHGFSAGERHGLQLYLNVETAEYISGPRDTVGFKAMVHHQHDVPNIEDLGFALSPGTHTLVAVSPQKDVLLPKPEGHSNCIEQSQGQSSLLFSEGNYSRSKCHIECVTSYIVNTCDCKYFYMPGNSSYCQPQQLRDCYFEAIDNLPSNNRMCSHCQDACDLISYNVKLSYQAFPSFPVVKDSNDNGGVMCQSAYTYYFRKVIEEGYYKTCLTTDDFAPFMTLLSSALDESNMSLNNTQIINDIINATLPIFYKTLHSELSLVISLKIYHVAFGMVRNNDTSFLDNASEVYNSTYQAVREHLIGRQWYARLLRSSSREPLEKAELKFNDTTIDRAAILTTLEESFTTAYDAIFESVYASYRSCFQRRFLELTETFSGEDVCYDYARQNLVKLNVYFENMVVNVITQRADYEIFSVICDIGGVLGLFFGASLLSIVEIFDFLVLRRCCKRTRRIEPQTMGRRSGQFKVDDKGV